MKKLFLFFAFVLSLPLFSYENSLFRDEDTGFVMEIPANMKRTWNVSHCENGIELNVFQSDLDSDQFSFIITGKIPLTSVLGEGVESFFPMILENLKEQAVEVLDEIELDCEIVSLTSLADLDYCAQRYHFSLSDEEGSLFLDLHSFLQDNYSFIVVTAVAYENRGSQKFEKFSQEVLKRVRFIEDKAMPEKGENIDIIESDKEIATDEEEGGILE